jgi:hypothetical protein
MMIFDMCRLHSLARPSKCTPPRLKKLHHQGCHEWNPRNQGKPRSRDEAESSLQKFRIRNFQPSELSGLSTAPPVVVCTDSPSAPNRFGTTEPSRTPFRTILKPKYCCKIQKIRCVLCHSHMSSTRANRTTESSEIQSLCTPSATSVTTRAPPRCALLFPTYYSGRRTASTVAPSVGQRSVA